MTVRDAVINVLINFGRFSGRATPCELGGWLLAVTGATVLQLLFDAVVSAPLLGFEPFAAGAGRPLTVIGSLLLLIPTLATMSRRLHDTSRPAAWLLLLLVPILGWAVLGWMLSRPSLPRDNRYGSDVIGLLRT